MLQSKSSSEQAQESEPDVPCICSVIRRAIGALHAPIQAILAVAVVVTANLLVASTVTTTIREVTVDIHASNAVNRVSAFCSKPGQSRADKDSNFPRSLRQQLPER